MIGSIPEAGAASRRKDELHEESEIPLEQAEFFRALGPERLASTRMVLRSRRFQRGRVVYHEGQPAEFLWVVRTGEVRLYKGSGDGRVTTLEVLHPGEMFGAVSALDSERYTASAEAVSDGTAWCLPRRVLLGLVADVPAAALEILVVTSRRLREAHERLRSFAHDPAPARLAQALLRRTQLGEAHVTRRALAEAAGTTVETAIRVLRRFEREGIVEGEVGRVRVVDEAALRKIAEGA
jgi:CRP-like cAMP-binding protein